MNSHVFILLGPVFPHRAFFVFVFRTFKRHFKSVSTLCAGRPIQPVPAMLLAGPQMRILRGGFLSPSAVRNPTASGDGNTVAATDVHAPTIA